ncbi:MAG TPA: M48 family metalloprotease [Pyrinomonadaceae bacterium]|nr:M48 family metalloprotease [Pyrinomonadaceae bacterium]
MMNKNLPIPFALLLILTVFYPSAAQQQQCAPPLPGTVRSEPNIFTEEQEIYLGDAVAEYIQKDYRVIEDPDVTAYLTAIGQRLTKHLPLNKLRFQFFLVDLPDANAFVIPGGRIYVSRKLVAAAQTEDELAGVIAHELGHLVAHDSAIDTTRQFREVLGVTSVGDRRDIFDKYNQLIESARLKPGAFKVKDREKGQLFADQAGMFALVSAGYDPDAMARFWDRVTGTEGKKGNWFTDLFGSTRPEQKRLREMANSAKALPAACRQRTAANQPAFAEWQSKVVAYTGLGRKESVRGVISKLQLTPPLRSDIQHLRFSPDGAYVIAQDDAGINVLSREPFTPLFRINTYFDTYYAVFTPDSKEIVFYSDNLRVERWNIAEARQTNVKEVVMLKGCLQTALSPDGKLLACLDSAFDLNLVRVETGEIVWKKKEFYAPDYWQYLSILSSVRLRGDDSSDLNLGLINMKFSPDARHLVAGYHGRVELGITYVGDIAEVIDTTTLTKVPISDSLKRFIAGGFAFIGNDRMAVINRENVKKSGLVKFPSGELIAEMELWRKGMTGATRGDYILIRPIKDYALGVMDINKKTIAKVNERAALDIHGPFFVAEMRNGEVGLYRMEKNELVASAVLSNVSLGRLRVAEVSPDLKWLALSGRSRGGVWNLSKAEAALALRSFQGGHVSDDGYFYGDFPKTDEVERNIAKFNLNTGDAASGPKIESNTSYQFGQYLFTIKSATAKEKPKPESGGEDKDRVDPMAFRRNVIIEMFDARTMKSLWSKAFPKETPRTWIAPNYDTMALIWLVSTDAAKAEISSDPRLAQQLSRMKEKQGDYFLKILHAQTGEEIGKLLIETGKASFRVANIYAAGDSVIVTDTENRVLVYSLKTGELKGRVFGGYATVSDVSKLLCVENETGKIAVYDLGTMEKRDEFSFSSPISMLRFSRDGQRLFVLTSEQMVYIFDVSSFARKMM